MWNGTTTRPLGEAVLKVVNMTDNSVHTVKFIVVKRDLPCLLGWETVRDMQLLTVNTERVIASVKSVDELGDLGIASLRVDPNITPRVLPCCKIPFAIADRVKAELDDLVAKEIISPVDEPVSYTHLTLPTTSRV